MLTELNVAGFLTTVDQVKVVSELVNLKKLDVSRLRMSLMEKCGVLGSLKNLTYLNFSQPLYFVFILAYVSAIGMFTIPYIDKSWIYTLPKLKTLILESHRFNEEKGLGDMITLTSLHMKRSHTYGVFNSISRLVNLETLDVSFVTTNNEDYWSCISDLYITKLHISYCNENGATECPTVKELVYDGKLGYARTLIETYFPQITKLQLDTCLIDTYPNNPLLERIIVGGAYFIQTGNVFPRPERLKYITFAGINLCSFLVDETFTNLRRVYIAHRSCITREQIEAIEAHATAKLVFLDDV